MNRNPILSIAVLLACTVASGHAQELTVYRCTAEDGRISLQDHPCAPEQAQQRREMQLPADAPPAPAAPEPAAVPTPAATARPEPRVALATPQPLYECERPDGSRYESETGMPQRHWVPLAMQLPNAPGIARRIGRPRITAPAPADATSAGANPVLLASGTWIEETCYALPAAEACSRRRDQLAQLGKDWYLAFPSERDSIELRQQSLREQLQTECGAR